MNYSKDTSIAPSLFREHLLDASNKTSDIHLTHYDYGVAGLLFFLYLLYVWLYVSNGKRLNQIVKGFYINRYANQLVREDFTIGNRVSVFLAVLFIFSLSIFMTQVNVYYGIIKISNHILFLVASLAITVVYSIKILFIKWLGFIFKTNKEAGEYRMSIFLFCNALGLFMFPVVVCIAFVKQASPVIFIYTGIGLLLIFLFMRLIRGVIIGLNSIRISKFYLFLYLCTLEILPFIMALKLFMLYV